ncbi:glycosyltransferase family 2 protein, partial [Cutibacterium acnes subsp. acnes]|nr:glycosyltransferase family 2 protein [Cutibacterium acnes subsp. acnes]
APIAVTGITAGTIRGLIGVVHSANGTSLKRWPLIGWAAPAGYASIIGVGSAAMKRDLDPGVRARLPLVLAIMHMSWGAGFLVGFG